MKEKIEKLEAYMLESSDFTGLKFDSYMDGIHGVEGYFKSTKFEIDGMFTGAPYFHVNGLGFRNIELSEILLHFGIIETNRFKNTKVTPSSLNLLAKIVRKSFDEKQITKERGQEIVDLAFQLDLPNADQMKIDHENNTYTPWI